MLYSSSLYLLTTFLHPEGWTKTKYPFAWRQEKELISKNLKHFQLKVSGLYGFDKAMVSRGGLSLKEVDAKNFKSKLFNNLYFAGEILDIDGPTGGYNLQIAWTSGYLVADDLFCK